MLFQSPIFIITFLVFFTVSILVFHKQDKTLRTPMLVMSLLFYYYWETTYSSNIPAWNIHLDWHEWKGLVFDFRLPLPFFITFFLFIIWVNFYCAKKIAASSKPAYRRALLTICVVITLAPLIYYKYSFFFLTILQQVLGRMGIGEFTILTQSLSFTKSLVLPLGLSFIDFQILSYTIDVYRNPNLLTNSYRGLVLFKFYFPLMAAGPIMRKGSFYPELEKVKKITPDNIDEGNFYFFRGIVKKVVFADFIALIVDPVYSSIPEHSFLYLFLITTLYAFQIYYDFSGYSDMAYGLSRYMDIRLIQNFNFPYLAKNPGDFWRRWHISLSTWFRDYVYIPLGGNRLAPAYLALALLVTFFLSGLWHGAGWGFILWGIYHGLLLVIFRFGLEDLWKRVPAFVQQLCTFLLVSFGWILFRCQHLRDLKDLKLFYFSVEELKFVPSFIVVLVVLFGIHHFGNQFSYQVSTRFRFILNHFVYPCLLILVLLFSHGVQKFIYFQF